MENKLPACPPKLCRVQWGSTTLLGVIPGGLELQRIGTPLLVQWLRLHAPNAGGLGLILDQGTRSYLQQIRA